MTDTTNTDGPGLAWSRAAWRTHLPDVDDPAAYLDSLGGTTLPALARNSARNYPDRTAVRIDDEHITHGQLDEDTTRIAGWLVDRIDPGDRVLLAGPSCVDFLRCYLGTLRAGGVVVLANPSYTAAELEHLVVDAEAVVAFAGEQSAARLGELADPPAVTRFGELAGQLRHSVVDLPEPGPDDTALLAYTSGTTGRPKGVPLSHRHLLTSIRSAMAAWRWSPDDVLVHALPLFHQHGLGGVHATLIAGSTARLLSGFEPATLAQAARQASVLFAVPTMYERLVESPGETFAGLRLCVCGSAPLSEVLAERVAETFGQLPLVRYGTTETGLDVSNPYGAARGDTIGLPLPGVRVRIADTDEPSGVDGEIQLRGSQVFDGYWRNPSATEESFTADGWFRTGDIGRVDPETGHLSIRGRTKELIITGGMNVYPREVELALEKHPDVAEVAVAGVRHEHWGEQVTAWVVPRDGRFDEPALIEHARSLLAPYKCPKRVYPLDALPRNQMGKIARAKLSPPEPSPVELALRSLHSAPLPDPAYDDRPGGESVSLPGPGPRLSVREALRATEAGFGAFVEVCPGEAVDTDGPLHGVPVALKDNIDVAGQPVRSGTPGIAHREPPSDSHVWSRLRAAGCVLIGRTTLSELAWSVHTPGCANPWDATRSPGGSSGGSAVAVATGAAAIALGTDTGGSIRIPAALCGVAGLRPTSGTVSMRGITPLAPSQDVVGPIAATARDCLLTHAALGGQPRRAPETAVGLRVGWPGALWENRVDPEVRGLLEDSATQLRAAGVEIVDVELPLARTHSRVASYLTMLAESAALWWQACQENPAGLGATTTELLRAGSEVSTSDYLRARRLAAAIRRELDGVLTECSALLLPTVPVAAADADARSIELGGRAEPTESAYYRLTALAAVTGHPALSVPAGLSAEGLPVGAQLIGRRCDESLLCLLGGVIENGAQSRALARARAERIVQR